MGRKGIVLTSVVETTGLRLSKNIKKYPARVILKSHEKCSFGIIVMIRFNFVTTHTLKQTISAYIKRIKNININCL